MIRSILGKALGLPELWEIMKDSFSAEEQRLAIPSDFKRGTTFTCPNAAWRAKHKTPSKRRGAI